MDWTAWLEPGESVRWEGRPAPGCFTFRNWRHSVFGILLLILSVYWLLIGVQLGALYELPILAWIPLPFLLAGLYLSMGHLLHARLEWDKVFYAVTERRVLAKRGFFRPRCEVLPLASLTHFRMKPLGEELGNFRLTGGDPPKTLVLSCIEHPGRLIALLEAALAANNRLQREVQTAAPAEARD